MRRFWLASFAALALLAAPVLAHEVGTRIAPDAVLGVDLEGKPVTLAKFAGKPVLVVFWASWCSDCMRELPTIEVLHKRWGERAIVLGISTDASRRDLTRFLRKNKARFTITVSHDADNQAARVFNVREIPTNLLVDANGVIRWWRIGFDDKWLAELDTALHEMQKPKAEKS